MDLCTLVKERYSVRGYKPDPVEDEKLNQILETARLAPSAANRQPVKLIVVKTAGRENELRRIYNSTWFVEAPYVICACGVPAQAWVRQEDHESYLAVDVAILFDHLILAATELGLGTCWIAAFDTHAAREVLDLPQEYIPVVFTPLGYPRVPAHPKHRKPLSELVEYR